MRREKCSANNSPPSHKQHRAFDQCLEFAHVAGEGVTGQVIQRALDQLTVALQNAQALSAKCEPVRGCRLRADAGRQLDRELRETVVQVLAEFASLTSVDRSRCVAAMMRTSILWVSLEPSGRISPSCSTRSSLACSDSGMSPTSSSNSVPPLAASNSPARSRSAPVKAPLR
jgi:hypothetical protein